MLRRPSSPVAVAAFGLAALILGGTVGARSTVMPVSEVRPGMVGVGRTVFRGEAVEEFTVRIIGTLKSVVAPQRDLILAKLEGGPLAETGVIAGMSGSPVYIDGRLVGAVSYQLGQFPKEADRRDHADRRDDRRDDAARHGPRRSPGAAGTRPGRDPRRAARSVAARARARCGRSPRRPPRCSSRRRPATFRGTSPPTCGRSAVPLVSSGFVPGVARWPDPEPAERRLRPGAGTGGGHAGDRAHRQPRAG